jgi:hypothetical protein
VFLMAVVAHLSWEVSRLEERTRRLAEEIALLRPVPPAGAAHREREIDLGDGPTVDVTGAGVSPGSAPEATGR